MRIRRTLMTFVATVAALAVPLVRAAPAQAFTGLEKAYQVVTLTNLDDSDHLRGDYADVCGTKSCASSSDAMYLYGRSDTWFEQVMAYYAVTQAELYIQSLGFTNVNNEPQNMRVSQFGGDNSFYDPK